MAAGLVTSLVVEKVRDMNSGTPRTDPSPQRSLSAVRTPAAPIVKPAERSTQSSLDSDGDDDEPSDGGKWQSDHGVSMMEGTISGIVILRSEDYIPTHDGHKKPALAFRCDKKKLVALLSINTPFLVNGEETQVITYRFGTENPTAQNWSESEDRQSVFASKPRDFYAKMRKASDLHIRFTPVTGPNRTVVFDVRGLELHAKTLEGCTK